MGGSLSAESESAVITGRLIHRGDILSYQNNNAGPSATLDCGDMTVVITKNRASMCRPDIFASIGLDFRRFHIVAVKLGRPGNPGAYARGFLRTAGGHAPETDTASDVPAGG